MNSTVYFLAEHYPWWGLPLALILLEVANHFRKSQKRLGMFLFGSLGFLFGALAILFFIYNGFETLRPAMQDMEKKYGL